MGVLHSIPLCSRGENKEEGAGGTNTGSSDKNNNTLPVAAAVTSQPLQQQHSSQSLVNENVPPEATRSIDRASMLHLCTHVEIFIAP